MSSNADSFRIPLSAPAEGSVTCATGPASIAKQPFSVFGSISQFRHAQKMAMMVAQSSIVPEHYRGDEHLANCVMALEIANRVGVSVFAVMQNLHMVDGRPAWASQFLISCVNASRRFSPLRYEIVGTRGQDDWGCIAWATDRSGEILKSPEITIQMAKAEGWFDRPGSKWKTMPELMLRYRSAALFARLYVPELSLGIQTAEELVDFRPAGNGKFSRPVFENATIGLKTKSKARSGPREAVSNKAIPDASNAGSGSNSAVPGSETSLQRPAVPPEVHVEAECQSVAALCEPRPAVNQYNYLKALLGLIKLGKHPEPTVLAFLQRTGKCGAAYTSLVEVAEKQPGAIVWVHDNWKLIDRDLSLIQQQEAK